MQREHVDITRRGEEWRGAGGAARDSRGNAPLSPAVLQTVVTRLIARGRQPRSLRCACDCAAVLLTAVLARAKARSSSALALILFDPLFDALNVFLAVVSVAPICRECPRLYVECGNCHAHTILCCP